MPPSPVYIASDAHLGETSPEMEVAFRNWLEHAADRAGLIFLNGDLFDFWFEWGSVIPQGHTRLLGTLARIVDAGVPVHLMGGNHDWWGGRYLTDEIGLTLHYDPVRLELAGSQVLLAHGDGLGRGDLGYKILRGVLRSRVAHRAFSWLHPDIATRIARRVSRTDGRHLTATDVERISDDTPEGEAEGGEPDPRATALERWARERLLEDDELDIVILGHSHQPARVEVAPGRFYLNSGDWLVHATYLVLRADAPPSLESWHFESE